MNMMLEIIVMLVNYFVFGLLVTASAIFEFLGLGFELVGWLIMIPVPVVTRGRYTCEERYGYLY